MAALRGQVADARKRKRVGTSGEVGTLDCRACVVWSGDMLSLCYPGGHQGPAAKSSCLKCLWRLHETNAAGVPQVAVLPEGWTETRLAHIADPPPRAGTAAISLQAKFYQADVAAHAAGACSKPEPMNYDSCIHAPLYRVRNSFDDKVSNIPLHLILGLTTDYFHALEARTEQLDSTVVDQLELPPTGSADLVKRLSKMLADMEANQQEGTQAVGEQLDHSNALCVLRERVGGDEAFAAAAGRRNKKREVPLEVEVRTHQKLLLLATARVKKTQVTASMLQAQLVELRAEKPGPFRTEWNETLFEMHLKCAAYHGGTLVGDDCDAVLLPAPIAKLTACIKPKLFSRVWPQVQPDGSVRVSFRVCAPGSRTEASLFADVMSAFAQCVSLFARSEPLCEHEIELFRDRRDAHAAAFAKAFPNKEPTIKAHWLGYHVYDQLLRWGSCGQFHEGVVEAAHVVDNELKRRYACVTDPLEQLRLRLQAYANSADASRTRLSAAKELRQKRSREKRNRGCRRLRHAM